MSFTAMWLMVFGVVFLATRRSRWHRRMARWDRMGSMGGGPAWGGGWDGGWGREAVQPGDAPSLRRQVADQQAHIETLETQLSRMEERLDFTERLLSGRKEARGTADQVGPATP